MDSIRFTLNERVVEVRGLPPTTTLLRYLRDHAGLSGTKEGCAEGDCGACTVVVLDPDTPRGPAWRAVCACILLLPQVHGRRVVTVEGLGSAAAPHPAQVAMAEALGSQCGYCTPGVVMSLAELCHRDDLDAAWKLDDQLCGNLCRCTGYRPIREAAQRVAGTQPEDALRRALPAPTPDAPLSYQAAGARFDVPTTLPTLLALRAAHPEARLIAGATELGLDVTQRHTRFEHLIAVDRVPELRAVAAREGGSWLGAAAWLSDVEAHAAAHIPALARALRFFGSRQIKNRASLGGNLVNASPIGDTAPTLIALGAQAHLASARGERILPVEALFAGYRRTALAPDEVLVGVWVPALAQGARVGAYKVSKRRELDISAVCAGLWVRLEEGRVAEARFAYGGVAGTPARARAAEAAVLGQPWTLDTVQAAQEALDQDFTPLSDHRGSAWFRTRVARNLLRGFWEETRHAEFLPLPDRPSATVVLPEAP